MGAKAADGGGPAAERGDETRNGDRSRNAIRTMHCTLTRRFAWRLLGGVAPALALAACALGPDFKRPDAPAGDHVVAAPAAEALQVEGAWQRFDANADIPARWWTLLGSPELDAGVDDAIAHSPTLQEARAALSQSQDALAAGYGVFYPQIGASVGAARQTTIQDIGGTPRPIGPYNLVTAGTTVSYVPDLFGLQRRSVEALRAQSDVQRYAELAAYLSLTSNVVNTAVARAGYRAQRDALREIVRMQDDQIHIAQVQYDAGTAAYGAVVALTSQRAANEASAAALEQRIDQSEHLLAQLGGRAPADAKLPPIDLDNLHLPAELPDTVPSVLARHRPDILAAESSLHAASAQIGVATADLFPSLSLGGTAGASQVSIAALLNSGTRFWSAQAQLAGSVFSGFSQWYARRAAIDAYQQSLATYRQTVLTGLVQIADAMTALGHDAQVLRAQSEALKAARQGIDLTRAGYEAGTAGYLDLLNADAQYQQARLAYAGAVAQRLQDTVALYAALGGGWWNTGKP
jgi:NodT family efflux transporter outer membrane factor (OMF) lipoprotein